MVLWWLLVPLCAACDTCEDSGLLQMDTQSGQTSLGSSLVVVSGCVSNAGDPYAEVCVTWVGIQKGEEKKKEEKTHTHKTQTKVSNRSLPATSHFLLISSRNGQFKDREGKGKPDEAIAKTNFHLFCGRHGYRLVFFEEKLPGAEDRKATWSKIIALQRVMPLGQLKVHLKL